MNEIASVWTHEYEVNTLIVTIQKRLGLFGLLNILQDIAWIHATHLGHGYQNMIQKQLIWALTRQKLVMQEWPKWGEKVQIRTWIRPIEGIFAHRDFEIFFHEKKIGECTTSWLTLDLSTRKPKKIDLIKDAIATRKDDYLKLEAPKIPLKTELKPLIQYQVKTSDLDLNDHVNNTRYAQWILDAIPHDWHKEYQVQEYEINFLAETKLDDLITVSFDENQIASKDTRWVQFQGVRESDQKTVFSARLLIKPV